MKLIYRFGLIMALATSHPQISSSTRILADDCGGCNTGICITPAISSENTADIDISTLGLKPSCQCKGTGFIGEHCQVPCSLDCQHGGKCEPAVASENNQEFCSCSKAVVDGNPFAGLLCEYGASKSCMTLGSESKHSFCTNDGECQDIVGDNEEHKDCICKDGFEGSHCEYLAGTTPTLSAAKSESSSEGSYSTSQPLISDNTLFSLLAVLTVCICVLVLAFYIRAKRREKNARREAIELAEATEDLAMVQDSEHGIDSDTEII